MQTSASIFGIRRGVTVELKRRVIIINPYPANVENRVN
jgi:hypothetical protein